MSSKINLDDALFDLVLKGNEQDKFEALYLQNRLIIAMLQEMKKEHDAIVKAMSGFAKEEEAQ